MTVTARCQNQTIQISTETPPTDHNQAAELNTGETVTKRENSVIFFLNGVVVLP